jgi:hypothetical protein
MRCIGVEPLMRVATLVAAIVALAATAHDARAQTAALPEYHAPTILIAAPAAGTALPEDRPVAVLRFVSTEPTDPIDALSFSIAVDGKDKTGLFQATQGEAWGPLVEPNETLASGQHELVARICTSHGACGIAKATVTVVASPSGLPLGAAKAEPKQKKGKILDAIMQAIRVLLR